MVKKTSSDDHREQLLLDVGVSLRVLLQAFDLAREKVAREQKLHPTDMRCLAYLERVGEPVSPKDIIGELGLTSGSGTALLDRLEGAGYIARIPNAQDRRSILISLTNEARASLMRYREMEAVFRGATVGLSEPDLVKIGKFLEDMSIAAKRLLD